MKMAEIMRMAHKLAKQMVGDYAARMVLALRQAWSFAKGVVEAVAETIDTEKLAGKVADAVRKYGCSAKIDDGDLEDEYRVYVSRQLSRGWQRMGWIEIAADGELAFGFLECNKAGVRNAVLASI